VNIEYKPISDGSVYTPGGRAAYPILTATRGYWVVSRHTVDNGTADGASNGFSYTYESGFTDLRGNGCWASPAGPSGKSRPASSTPSSTSRRAPSIHRGRSTPSAPSPTW
jgi:hypothetical protein